MKYSLTDIDGNAFCIMGYVVKAMLRENFSESEIDAYLADCKSSNYDHLIQVSDEMCDRLNSVDKDS